MKEKFKVGFKRFGREFVRDWQLHLLMLLPAIYIGIFHYAPMYGVQIAFRDYRPTLGITGSEWVGLKWFKQFLNNYEFMDIFGNTMAISLYTLCTFPLAVILALMLNALRQEKYKKLVQTVSYVPHFISTAVMVGILNMVLSPVSGFYGNLYRLFGGTGYPVDFRGSAAAFRHLYVWSGVWKGLGWDSIVYVSALSSVSAELHEAAQIDGASRLKRMWHIDLPTIMPTVAILLIMKCGGLISVGFEKAYLLQRPLNLEVSEVISTYVFKVGLTSFKNFSFGSAVGLFNTVISLTLVLLVNGICKKLTEDEVSLF